MSIKDMVERIWQYSNYYGDMVFTSLRLYDAGEGYAATAILFNAVELVFKSIRENYKENFNQDIKALKDSTVLTEEEYDFFENKKYGIREIRNIMTHREAYQYCFEAPDGKALLFTEQDTWMILFEQYSPSIISILYNALIRSKDL